VGLRVIAAGLLVKVFNFRSMLGPLSYLIIAQRLPTGAAGENLNRA